MLGNRTAKHVNGNPAAAYQYNAMNQLTAVTQGEDLYSYLYDSRGNLTEERCGEQILKRYVYDATNHMISGTNLVNGKKSEYTYNGLYARVKKTSDAAATTYMPDYLSSVNSDLVTQISGIGTVNAVYGQRYGHISQRFTPEAGTNALSADTYFQHDLYGSTLFASDAQGVIKHHAAHDIWGMPKTVCGDSSITSGLRFTAYDYDSVLDKHFAQARMYDPSQGRMLGVDPVKRGLNGYAYCSNDPVNQIDPTGEIANVLLGGVAGGIIGFASGFAGSALSQLAEGRGFSARKACGAAANGAIVGAARGALIGSGAGIPAALGVNFAAGMAGSLAEQKIVKGRLSPVRAAVDGVFNAIGGRLYGTSPLRNAKNAFIRGALEGAVKGGAYNIADVLDNKLRNAYGSKKPAVRSPRNPRGVQPPRSRCPQKECVKSRPLAGMNYPGKGGRGGSFAPRNDRFSLGRFARDIAIGAVMSGLASVAFYKTGKGVEALKRSVRKLDKRSSDTLLDYNLQYFAKKNITNYAKLRNTKNIRYSQKSINPYFDNGSNIKELIAYLKADPSYARKVAPIRLVKFKDLPIDVQKVLKMQGASSFTVFALDNRRLYAAKTAGVKVNSRWATQQDLDSINLIRRFSTVTEGKTIQVRW